MDSIKEFFAQHTISTKKDNEIIVHYQIFANKESTSFEINASLLYLYNSSIEGALTSQFQELKAFMEEDNYISLTKIDINHEKESVEINKKESVKVLEIENVLFNEAIKLIKQNAKDSYKIENLGDSEDVVSLKEKENKDFKILTNENILNRFKELNLEIYELREKNESLSTMAKGIYNEKMSIYKSVIASLLLLAVSGFLIAYM